MLSQGTAIHRSLSSADKCTCEISKVEIFLGNVKKPFKSSEPLTISEL